MRKLSSISVSMRCRIFIKDTVVDMQKLIDGVNSQKLDLNSAENKNIKAASVYNTAIDDSLYEIKNAVYPHYKALFPPCRQYL